MSRYHRRPCYQILHGSIQTNSHNQVQILHLKNKKLFHGGGIGGSGFTPAPVLSALQNRSVEPLHNTRLEFISH